MGGYSSILLFVMLAAMVSSAFAVLPVFLARKKDSAGKLSSYECGFDQGSAPESSTFDIKFCVVAILFVVFDIEVAFLFPWAVCLGTIGAFGFWSMVCFMLILTVGFIYEWGLGALEWE
ncbi:NADH-quinone oxidoreductase subunit A [Anaplasma capra]|uniref:NADH-quinone oxidoreductase subunit A n=1 Tax=Anaplasma capra TaxID=1562740 RepID=UPI0021D5BE68|nr:NADH-quinone oxidoreductase subunit A [Anaplasma capra]MCU7611457.1 NADH-quinone oxidoreductase subunit A [Anaplasma capra]MCU7612104.1 NADH-quinone oxidoreductase subunit A [Anaplasma capra]